MTATLTGPVQTPRSSSQMTPCLPKASVSLWRMWWIRAVPGAFPERKMDISSLFISMGLSGTGSALHGRRNTGCAGAGSPFGMGQRDHSWSQEKSLWISLASSARLSLFPAGISKSFKAKWAEWAAYLGCSSHLEYCRKCVSLICKISAVFWTILKAFFVVRKLCCYT